MIIRLKQVREREAERYRPRSEAAEGSATRGADLETARREDLAWRAARRSRARSALRKLVAAYDAVTDLIARLGLILALALIAGVLTLPFTRFLGFEEAVGLGSITASVAISGIALLIVLGGSCWLLRLISETLLHKWAENQAIDLEPDLDDQD